MTNTNIPVINDQETKEILELYRSIPANKKAAVIAFIQGMEAERTIEVIESSGCNVAV